MGPARQPDRHAFTTAGCPTGASSTLASIRPRSAPRESTRSRSSSANRRSPPPRHRGALCVHRSPCRGHADPGNADTVGRVETDGPDFVETKVADGRLRRLERAVSSASVHGLHGCQHRHCGQDGCRSSELPQFEDADSVEGVGATASLRDDPVSPDIPTLPLQATRDRHRSPVDAP